MSAKRAIRTFTAKLPEPDPPTRLNYTTQLDENVDEVASKAIQLNYINCIKRNSVNKKIKEAFIALFEHILKVSYPHIHQQKVSLRMLDMIFYCFGGA